MPPSSRSRTPAGGALRCVSAAADRSPPRPPSVAASGDAALVDAEPRRAAACRRAACAIAELPSPPPPSPRCRRRHRRRRRERGGSSDVRPPRTHLVVDRVEVNWEHNVQPRLPASVRDRRGFPQRARWSTCSRTLAHFHREASAARILSRGELISAGVLRLTNLEAYESSSAANARHPRAAVCAGGRKTTPARQPRCAAQAATAACAAARHPATTSRRLSQGRGARRPRTGTATLRGWSSLRSARVSCTRATSASALLPAAPRAQSGRAARWPLRGPSPPPLPSSDESPSAAAREIQRARGTHVARRQPTRGGSAG